MVVGTTPPAARVAHTYSHLSLLHILLLFHLFPTPPPSTAEAAASSAPLGTLWETGRGASTVNCTGGSLLSPVLITGASGPSFAAGFICRPPPYDAVLFAVYLVRYANSGLSPSTAPQVVWSANRNGPVAGQYAALRLAADGDLRLSDLQGRSVWSTNTSGRGVASVNLTEDGNLVLLDGRSRVVWQSYDHPTDTALLNQSLAGLKLVANASAASSSEGAFYLSVTETSYSAYIAGNGGGLFPPQMYFKSGETLSRGILLRIPNSTEGLFLAQLPPSDKNNSTGPPPSGPSISALKFARLEADGRLRLYKWQEDSSQWEPKEDLLEDHRGDCKYPTECKTYGVCDEDNDCSCPGEEQESSHNPVDFELVNPTKHKEGCRPLKPWSCGQPPRLVPYDDVAYFGYVQEPDIPSTDVQSCKQACLSRNCSCQAAFFRYNASLPHNNGSLPRGDCYLPSTLYSLIRSNAFDNQNGSVAFIKVLDADDNEPGVWSRGERLVAEIGVPIFCFLMAVLVGSVLYKRRQRLFRAKKLEREGRGLDKEGEDFTFDHLPGMPTRFPFDELDEATGGFTEKLGEGGFGAVFRGTLRDGTQVAVKILGYRGQGMKEFLAEVETIGSIHHLHLVRLIGYCAERLHRMLVYEYLANGSLDKWIFNDDTKGGAGADAAAGAKPGRRLDFATKYRIILHVARGLSYLHDDCRHKIIHLDIKPQNILLDAAFGAKVSDFGLSKLVDRDQSEVVTTLRGTLGYLAPEWAGSTITEKADVYSFGVVVLETVSGRRILDSSRSEGGANLVRLLHRAAQDERLSDIIVDTEDVDEEEAMRLVKVATWCLQMDFHKRPPMSTVVKVLEGFMEVDPAPLEPWTSPWTTSMSMATTQAGGSSMAASPSLWSDVAGPR